MHFHEAGLPCALQILMHLLTGLLVEFLWASEAQDFSDKCLQLVCGCNLPSVHGGCSHTDLSCWRTKPPHAVCSHLWFKTHLQSSVQGAEHWRSVYLPLYQPSSWCLSSFHCCPSQPPGQSSNCGLWRRSLLHRKSPQIVCSNVWDLDEPCPCLGLGVTVLQCPRESAPQKGLWTVLVIWLLVIFQMFSSTSKINQNLVWKRKCFTVQLTLKKKKRSHMLDIFWVLCSVFLQLIFSRWAV